MDTKHNPNGQPTLEEGEALNSSPQTLSERIQALSSSEKRARLAKRLTQQVRQQKQNFPRDQTPGFPKPSAAPDDEDIVGGLAGGTLARQLKQAYGRNFRDLVSANADQGLGPEIKILVVEKRPYPMPEVAHKVGESTIELGSHYLLEVIAAEIFQRVCLDGVRGNEVSVGNRSDLVEGPLPLPSECVLPLSTEMVSPRLDLM